MKSSKPSAGAWIASLFSLALLAVVIVLVKVPFDQLHRMILAEETKDLVRRHLFADAHSSARRLFDETLGEKAVRKIGQKIGQQIGGRGGGSLLWFPDRSVPQLIDTIEALREGNLEAIRMGLDDAFAPSSGAPREVRDLSDAIAEVSESDKRLKEIRAATRRPMQEYVVARDNLRLFLGFSPGGARSDQLGNEDVEFPVYNSGVLEGLPRLRELPDEYKDLAELRKAIEPFGVQVKVSGPDPMQDFQITIADLRSKFAGTREQISIIEERRLSSTETLTRAEEEILGLRNNVRKVLEAKLDVLLSPPGLFERINNLALNNHI